MRGDPPVFWPTLRWAATPTQVAYPVGPEDRVVVWDVGRGDSTVLVGTATPRRATKAAALAATNGYSVATPAKRCEIGREQVLEQRGMMKTMPVIERVALSPDGALWVSGLFLSNTRFVALETDGGGKAVASLWEIRNRL